MGSASDWQSNNIDNDNNNNNYNNYNGSPAICS